MRKFKNFELWEFLQSSTAKKRNIDNIPTFEEVEHLEELISKILQPLRTAYGKSLRINSGFRCAELNRVIGGTDTSAHRRGYAADVSPEDGNVIALIEFAEKWMIERGIKWDQSINEKDKNGSHWWHIGLYDSAGNQRCQSFKLAK